MKRRQTIILLAVLALTGATPLRAQYFDWVRTYQSTHSSGTGSPDRDNMVLDMDADSQGNVYFLGRFVRGAAINGEELLEEVNTFNPPSNLINLCIVKMSPQGEMVWHKAISEWGMHQGGGAIQLVGDSTLVCYVGIEPPRGPYPNEPVYWLDSLIQYPDWFIPTDSIWCGTALITLDLDGNLKEQHFLNVGFLDTLGVPVLDSDRKPFPTTLGLSSMHIDSDGNIILGVITRNEEWYRRVSCDTCESPSQSVLYSVENGGIETIRILVDGVRTISYRPENRPIRTNAKLLKFSPHFDSLLEVRYLMQSRLDSPRTGLGVPGITKSEIQHITSDPEGNIYVVGEIDVSNTDTIVPIDSLQGLSLHLRNTTGFFIKYDSHLRPIFAKQLDFEGYKLSHFTDCLLEENDLFVLVCAGGREAVYSYDGIPLNEINYGTTFFRLSKEDGRLLSYGTARPKNIMEGSCHVSPEETTLSVKNNRVATQVKFLGNVAFAGDTIYSSETSPWGTGFVIWDYEGHQLKIVDCHTPHPDNRIRGALFTDSSLYLCGMFNGEATFGDTSFNVLHSNGYIARYVDTSFLHPYVHPEHPDTGDVRIVLAESGVAFVAYPNPFRQRVTIIYSGSDPIASAFITDMLGRREPVSLLPLPADAGGSTRFVADLTTAPQATYLLTLVTASGHQHTLRLFKQSDLFED